MEATLEVSFLDYFKALEDPWSERNRDYTMAEILLITLCAAICGAESWQDVEDSEGYSKSLGDRKQPSLGF